MNSVVKIVEVLGLLLVGVILVGWWWTNRDYRRRFPPEKEAAEAKAIEERMLRPDWGFYERHLQRPVPEALRQLYSDHELLKVGHFAISKRHTIGYFIPVDERSLLDTADQLGFDVVAFAHSDCGDAIYLRPGAKETDTVYIAHHDDPGHEEMFAESVALILQKVREMNQAA
jgi:hypothetical protein